MPETDRTEDIALMIVVHPDDSVHIEGPIHLKAALIKALAVAISTIVDFQPPGHVAKPGGERQTPGGLLLPRNGIPPEALNRLGETEEAARAARCN
jgi:hypothetical protein